MDITKTIGVVTGGASGLGEATVENTIDNGGKSLILDLNAEKGNILMEKHGKDKVLFIETDITDESKVREAVNQGVEHFGYVNALINCAGVPVPHKVLNKEEKAVNLEKFNKEIDVNLKGTYTVIQIVSEVMAKNIPNEDGERGVIINTASVAAFDGQIGQHGYSAAKGGIVAMTLPIARELARQGIRVMTIAPGTFKTPMMDILSDEQQQELGNMVPFPKRLGKPTEYAKLVQTIIEVPMLNGETIRLDGAIRMQPK